MKHMQWKKGFVIALVVLGMLVVLGFIFVESTGQLEGLLSYASPSQYVFLGKILSITNNQDSSFQTIEVQGISGPIKGQTIEMHDRPLTTDNSGYQTQVGETVLVTKNLDPSGDTYYITDRYRLPLLIFMFLLFAAMVILFGRLRGLTSLLGLIATVLVLFLFIVPRILAGQDPLTISVIGSVIIAIISLYLAHGFSKRTSIALAGTLIMLLIATGLTVLFVSLGKFVGIATEEAYYLHLSSTQLNLHGLLLGAIIIGMLGVLDDVTIGQATTVYELSEANKSLGFKELYRRGTSVGREHIASVVNTLVLAYAGAAFPILLYVIVQSNQVPLWLAVNSEPIAQEIVRTLIGSMALILAVPLTTALAAYYYGKQKG